MPFRYEFRFDLDPWNERYGFERGIRCQFFIDYDTADGVQELANHPHALRRDWARLLLQRYRNSGKTILTASDFNTPYGLHVRAACLNGATITCLEPNNEDQDVTLVIQVLYFTVALKEQMLLEFLIG